MRQLFSRKAVFICTVLLIAVCVITADALSARRRPTTQNSEKRVVELPRVLSKVTQLRVTSVTVANPGTPEAAAIVEILNTSHLAVMSVEMSTANKRDSAGVSEDGLTDPNNPKVVIPPFGAITLRMSFSEMIPDAALAISAAEFSDETSAGDSASLRGMRAVRKNRQELRQAEKNSINRLRTGTVMVL